MKTILFSRIDPTHLPIAYFLSLFFDIVYWRRDKVPPYLLKRFSNIDPMDYFTTENWEKILESLYIRWKQYVQENEEELLLETKIFDTSVDFTTYGSQRLIIDFDEEYQATELFKEFIKDNPSRYYLFSPALFRSGKLYCSPPCTIFPFSRAYSRLWPKLTTALMAIKETIALLKPSPDRHTEASYSICWKGIAVSEIADGPDQLDFSFLTKQNFSPKGQNLYFLPRKPTAQSAHWYRENKIHWVVLNQWASFLSCRERISSVLFIWKHIFISSNYLAQAIIKSTIWHKVIQKFQFKIVLTSDSATWPENPEVCLMNAMGVKTIIWHYSANVLGYSATRKEFFPERIYKSICASQEIWVWSPFVADFLQNKNVFPNRYSPRYRCLGPSMCGQSFYLKTSPSSLRKKHNIPSPERTFIALFDVPTEPKKRRLERGLAITSPYYPTEMLVALYEDFHALVENDDNFCLLIKPKRSPTSPMVSYPQEIKNIIFDPNSKMQKENRIIVFPHNSDPYLPIGMADCCVGLPFTSPVLAAIGSGRQGFFYDPLNTVNIFYPLELNEYTIHGREKLFQKIKNPTDIKANPQILGPEGSPEKLFVRYLDLLS
jgi:hypothetical protein